MTQTRLSPVKILELYGVTSRALVTDNLGRIVDHKITRHDKLLPGITLSCADGSGHLPSAIGRAYQANTK